MEWVITVAIERNIVVKSDNINDAVRIANEKKSSEERIVKIRLER